MKHAIKVADRLRVGEKKHTARRGEVFASHRQPTEEAQATKGDLWFWIAVTLACVPWLAALVAVLVWR